MMWQAKKSTIVMTMLAASALAWFPERAPGDVSALNLNQARHDLYAVRLQAEHNLFSSAQWQDAADARQTAQREYEAARIEALGDISERPNYRADLNRKQDLELELATLRRDETPIDRIYPVAMALLAINQRISGTEAAALASNGRFAAARTALQSANAKLLTLRNTVNESITSDSQWQAAQARLQTAKQQYVSASRQYDASVSQQQSYGRRLYLRRY